MARLRYLLWILPAIGLILATVGFTARRGGVVAWLRALPLVDSVQGQLDAPVGPRPALWGTTEEGDAFDHYRDAMNHACTLAALGGAEWQRQLGAATSLDDGGLEAAIALVAEPSAQRCIQALGRGAHASNGTLRIAWSQPEPSLPSLIGADDVQCIVFAQAIVLLDAREDVAAVQALLDGLQFGADLAEAPIGIAEIIGTNILGSGRVEALISLRGWTQIAPPARSLLVRGLQQLSERLSFAGHGDAGEFVYTSRVMEHAFHSMDEIAFGGEAVTRAMGAEFIQVRAGQLQRTRWATQDSLTMGLRSMAADAEINARSANAILRHGAFSRDSLGQRTAHFTRFRATIAALLALDGDQRVSVRDSLDNAFDVLLTESSVRVRAQSDGAVKIEVLVRR